MSSLIITQDNLAERATHASFLPLSTHFSLSDYNRKMRERESESERESHFREEPNPSTGIDLMLAFLVYGNLLETNLRGIVAAYLGIFSSRFGPLYGKKTLLHDGIARLEWYFSDINLQRTIDMDKNDWP